MLWQSRQYAGKLSGCRVQVEMQLAAFGCQRRIEVIPNGTEVQAVNSLRSETGYRHWENDLTPDDTPYEAGMGFGVKLYKGNFVGRNALIVQKARPLTKRMSQIVLKGSKPKLYGNEPVYRDGKNVGELTSGTYAFKIGAATGFCLRAPGRRRGRRSRMAGCRLGSRGAGANGARLCKLQLPL